MTGVVYISLYNWESKRLMEMLIFDMGLFMNACDARNVSVVVAVVVVVGEGLSFKTQPSAP